MWENRVHVCFPNFNVHERQRVSDADWNTAALGLDSSERERYIEFNENWVGLMKRI